MDRIDPHAVAEARRFKRRRLGEQLHSALRRAVGAESDDADQAGDRGQVDDGATYPRHPARPHRPLRAEKAAVRIHRHHAAEVGELAIDAQRRSLDAGVVHDDVEPAPAADRGRECALPVRFVG